MLENWRQENITFMKGKKEDPCCRPISFTVIPWKVMEQLILETNARHLKEKKVRCGQGGLNKERLYFTGLLSFCN